MKRMIIGIVLTFSGVMMNTALIIASAVIYAGARFTQIPTFWYVLLSPPGADPMVAGPGFLIPAILSNILLVLGLVLIMTAPMKRNNG